MIWSWAYRQEASTCKATPPGAQWNFILGNKISWRFVEPNRSLFW